MSPARQSRRRARRRAPAIRLHLEALEDRCLLSAAVAPANATLDQANSLGTLTGTVAVSGAVAPPAEPAQVNWYSFALTRPANVTLSARPWFGQPGPVLSLYNSDASDFADLLDPLGHRLVAQAQGGVGGAATITRPLAAGTYYVAVSGAGNRYFNPFLADSGYPGAGASYRLTLSETDLPLAPAGGPVVLASTPNAGDQLGSSPLVVRLDLSTALDPTTVLQGQDVRLTFNPTGQFGDPAMDQDVPLSNVNYTPEANELQIVPVDALAPGYYRVFLGGDSSGGQPVLLGASEVPLGTNAAHPSGQDFALTFRVTGVEGNPSGAADDTFATAHSVGNVTTAGLVQVAGTIGNDPAYDPNNPDPNLANAAADVDMYHFQITGPGNYALTAEAFAGRIGSPLDPALSLFKVDPATGKYQLLGVNDNTLNSQQATNGSLPLFTDPVLYAGLTAGDYYLAVSGSGNAPDPSQGLSPGVSPVFDPTVTHSGSGGYTTGDYVLNLFVQPASAPPQVVNGTFTPGAQLGGPPTTFVVQFSEPVNLPQLLYQASQQTNTTNIAAVYVKGSDGVRYYPRMVSYDAATNQATFLMLDAVPNGPAELHLSGPGGLTDLAGQPLVGSPAASGDYVVPFTVNGPARGSAGNPLLWYGGQANDTAASPQVLGTLFPHEFQKGVVVKRLAQKGATDTADYYQFQVLQGREYVMTLSGTGLPAGALPSLTDAAGRAISGVAQGKGGIKYTLNAGTYVVRVGGWASAKAASVKYQLRIGLTGAPENPPPLTIGPAPAIRVQFAEGTPPAVTTGGTTTGGTTTGGTTTGGTTTTPPPTGGVTTPPAPVTPPTGGTTPAGGNTGPAGVVTAGPSLGPVAEGPVAPAVEVVRLSPAAVAAAPVAASPGGLTASALDISAGVLLVRVADAVGVRGEAGADGAVATDRVFVQAQSPAAIQQLARLALVGVTSVQEAGGDDPTPGAGLVSAPAADTQAEGPQAAPPPAPALPPMPARAAVVRGLPNSPLDTLFAMNPLLNRLGAPAAGGAAVPASLGLGGLLAAGPSGPSTGGDEARPHGWLDALAWVSACAALALASWGVVNPALRRRPDEAEETASLLN
jgi:hypothetical protein